MKKMIIFGIGCAAVYKAFCLGCYTGYALGVEEAYRKDDAEAIETVENLKNSNNFFDRVVGETIEKRAKKSEDSAKNTKPIMEKQ